MDLYWLPECRNWKEALDSARTTAAPWHELVNLARARLDFVKTAQVSNVLETSVTEEDTGGAPEPHIRLAVLSSSTSRHLLPGLKVAALRRRLHIHVYACGYGQYQQELLDADSELHRFRPDVVLIALDARHVLSLMTDGEAEAVETLIYQITDFWRKIQAEFGCQVVQQTILPIFPSVIGNNDHRLITSRRWRIATFNYLIRKAADSAGVDLLAIDSAVERYGIAAWYNDALWHKAKQEIQPSATPMYGELAVRLIAAQRGRSSKCLVLDLDNTLWGGVIGDDGVEGIVLGQGSALGEAYVDFQRWVLAQARRGVILSVCSKNDEANAVLPFERHPDMVLSRSDIAVMIANWDDKPANLRMIAERLNIGLDSLVFADDNPFERNIVRRELPEVEVPELPEDPALYSQCLADAGYFEGLAVTADDLTRSMQYQANAQRETLRASATDLNQYLASLKMQLQVKSFDTLDLKRIVQLINKTNQFNLTTRRYSDAQVESFVRDEHFLNLQFRLADSLGDNGIISIIIGKLDEANASRMTIDSWLMSCRVLGRQVELACLNALVARAKSLGVTEIVGAYIPTNKNGLVRDHYQNLRFEPVLQDAQGRTTWRLSVPEYVPFHTSISTQEA
jgi:FkbH-like protein